jgi:hypothetical protein
MKIRSNNNKVVKNTLLVSSSFEYIFIHSKPTAGYTKASNPSGGLHCKTMKANTNSHTLYMVEVPSFI